LLINVKRDFSLGKVDGWSITSREAADVVILADRLDRVGTIAQHGPRRCSAHDPGVDWTRNAS